MAGYALPTEAEERQVLVSCLLGEEDGLDLLYRRYCPPLVAFCHRRLGNRADAEDAAHETILRAHGHVSGLREDAGLWPWLATIAANLCTDVHRSRRRFERQQGTVSALGEVDEEVGRRARAAIVNTALDELPERYRTPLFLREFLGYSYDEIATFSSKPVGSVRSTLMRARRALQASVEDVARRNGQWPMPSVVAANWGRRGRATLRSWRNSAERARGNLSGTLVMRAEAMLVVCASGLQAATAAAGLTFAVHPGAAPVTPRATRPTAAGAAVVIHAEGGNAAAGLRTRAGQASGVQSNERSGVEMSPNATYVGVVSGGWRSFSCGDAPFRAACTVLSPIVSGGTPTANGVQDQWPLGAVP